MISESNTRDDEGDDGDAHNDGEADVEQDDDND